jgi:hypothetical protein
VGYKRTGNKPGRPKKPPPIRGAKPKLRREQWEAIEIEYQGFDGAREPWPSTVTLAEVAAACRRTEATVCRWRHDPDGHYRQGLIWRATIGQEPSMTFVEPAPAPEFPVRTHEQSMQILKDYPQAHQLGRVPWSGSVACVLCEDEPVFDSLEDYIEHIDTAHPDAVWIGGRRRRHPQ